MTKRRTEDRISLQGRKVLQCFPFHRLPESLTDLSANLLLPASQLKCLPRRLQHLHIDDIFEDADYDAESKPEMEAMRSIFEVGSREGVRERFDWTLLNRTSMALQLPRTLIDLSVWADTMVDRVDWRHLPPNMRNLWLGSTKGITASCIADFPTERANYLRLPLTDIQDEHLKALPRNVDMRIELKNATQLTPKAALFFPPGVVPIGDPFKDRKIEWMYEKLNEERAKHAEDDDPALFLKLISWDESVLDMYPYPF